MNTEPPLIRAEGFNTPPLGAVKSDQRSAVLNPECNTLLEQHTPLLAAGLLIKGIELNRGFYFDIVKPILEKSFPNLRYSASLIGYGSDVLGLDTARSTDHNWGPRMQIFVDDALLIPRADKCLREQLPFEYRGFPVNFSDPGYDKTQRMERTDKRPINHLIEISTFEDYLEKRYSIDKTNNLSLNDWLRLMRGIPGRPLGRLTDQKLLEICSGEVFHDGLEKLNRTRKELEFYPQDICKLRLAVLWHYISNKEAFVGRCIALNDFAGLKINTSRLVNYLMKILFYLEGKYIPYSKWFGSVFKKLDAYEKAGSLVEDILAENNPKKIEDKLCLLYTFVVERHNAAPGMPRLGNTVRNYFGRPYKVIFAETIIDEIKKSIVDEEIRNTDLRNYAYDIILDE